MRRALPWAGLVIMVGSLVWLESLPKRIRLTSPVATLTGPASRLIIDPGHGGLDSGTIRNSILEKDLTLDVALRVERLAKAKGFATAMTRRTDEQISLAGRAALANRERDGIFVSLHFDEGTRAEANGVQTFYAVRQDSPESGFSSWLPFLQPVATNENNLASQSLAAFIQEALVAGTHAFNRGTRAEQFYVVAHVRHPAVLVEGGFLSNPEDLARLITAEYREQLAASIVEGLSRYRTLMGERPPTLAVGAGATE